MEAMKTMEDNQFDLAIVDPPYGLGKKLTDGGTWASKYTDNDSKWDIKPDNFYFDELFRVSNHQIIWGGNYFKLPPSRCFVIWDKPEMRIPTMANCEYAWVSFDKCAKIYQASRATTGKRIHPTQKPVALYKWLLQNYAKPGDKILDTHAGSFSIGIACWDLKFDLTAYELDEEYYNAAMKRFNTHCKQGQLF
jgi:site-specific DNA-methyltransferase (adenine-specific)